MFMKIITILLLILSVSGCSNFLDSETKVITPNGEVIAVIAQSDSRVIYEKKENGMIKLEVDNRGKSSFISDLLGLMFMKSPRPAN